MMRTIRKPRLTARDRRILEAARALPQCDMLFNRNRSVIMSVEKLGWMVSAVERHLEGAIDQDDICHGFAKLSVAGEISLW